MAWNPLVLYDVAGKATGPSIGINSNGIDWNNVFNNAFNSFNTFFTTRRAVQAAPYTGQFYPTPQVNYPVGYNQYANNQYGYPPAANVANNIGGAISTTLASIGAPFGVSGTTAGIVLVGGLLLLIKEKPKWARRS